MYIPCRTCIADQIPFCITYLSVLREYIDCEFKVLKDSLKFPYDLERIIDDWIFMAFLLGNDFIPHIPNLHIHAESLLVLWDTYHVVLPRLDGYLVEFGRLNLRRFHFYLEELSKFEQAWFEEREADHRWMRGKRGAQLARQLDSLGKQNDSTQRTPLTSVVVDKPETIVSATEECDGSSPDNELSNLATLTSLFAPASDCLFEGEFLDETADLLAEGVIANLPQVSQSSVSHENLNTVGTSVPFNNDLVDTDEEETEEDLQDEDFLIYKMHRRDYYWSKLGIESASDEDLRKSLMPLIRDYVRMLQWILNYYFLRVVDWSFFYAYHYSPFACDLKLYTEQFLDTTTPLDDDCLWADFDTSTQPILPFTQQLMILPADSAYIVPKPFRPLMTEPTSPLAPFFPSTFTTDINGKIASWEAVVLIPFIDEKTLVDAMAPLHSTLTVEESNRNSHKSHFVFPASSSHSSESAKVTVVQYAHDFFREGVQYTTIQLETVYSRPERDVCADFPSLHRLRFSTELRRVPVHVFETPSRLESLTLVLTRTPANSISMEKLANKLLGRPVRVRWPHCAIVMPVRLMSNRELWELQDFNVTPIGPYSELKRERKPLAKFTRLIETDRTNSQESELDWFSNRVGELERHLRIRRAILFEPDESDPASPILMFSRRLEGWSIRRLPRAPGSGHSSFTLVPSFTKSRYNNGTELQLTPLEPKSAWFSSGTLDPGAHSRKFRRRAVIPSMSMEPAHGQLADLELDLLELVVPGVPPPPSVSHVKLDWNFNQPISLASVFHLGQVVLTLQPPHTGCVGEVVGIKTKRETVSVRLYSNLSQPVDLSLLKEKRKNADLDDYMVISALAAAADLPLTIVIRMTGTVLVAVDGDDCLDVNGPFAAQSAPDHSVQPRACSRLFKGPAGPKRRKLWNIGLNLRRNKTHAQILGWSRFCPVRSTWVFSRRTVELLKTYSAKFPKLWSLVANNISSSGPLIAHDLSTLGSDYFSPVIYFPLPEADQLLMFFGLKYVFRLINPSRDELDAAVEFLEQSACRSAAVVPVKGDFLDTDWVKQLRALVYPDVTNDPTGTKGYVYRPLDRTTWVKSAAVHCEPESLFAPVNACRNLYPIMGTASISSSDDRLNLLDRVVFCKSGQTVPLGLQGTVIGVLSTTATQTVEVMFDKQFPGAVVIRYSGPCCATVQSSTLIKLPSLLNSSSSYSKKKIVQSRSNHFLPTGRGMFTRAAIRQPIWANEAPPTVYRPWPRDHQHLESNREGRSPKMTAGSNAVTTVPECVDNTDHRTEIEELNALLFATKPVQQQTSILGDVSATAIDNVTTELNSLSLDLVNGWMNSTQPELPVSQPVQPAEPSPPETSLPPVSWAHGSYHIPGEPDASSSSNALNSRMAITPANECDVPILGSSPEVGRQRHHSANLGRNTFETSRSSVYRPPHRMRVRLGPCRPFVPPPPQPPPPFLPPFNSFEGYSERLSMPPSGAYWQNFSNRAQGMPMFTGGPWPWQNPNFMSDPLPPHMIQMDPRQNGPPFRSPYFGSPQRPHGQCFDRITTPQQDNVYRDFYREAFMNQQHFPFYGNPQYGVGPNCAATFPAQQRPVFGQPPNRGGCRRTFVPPQVARRQRP
ncbi:5'-3' exoribonuclease 1 [Paragonimus westermani]|uniref:5'-3' exoribonuclease 1 n=1 Tax=Paragonimus westermani TaxID=34504 RepID=A0A5J4NPC0_9TREM|nr:5'-3' exoribonuclease 1 [Paragonimus westermani]